MTSLSKTILVGRIGVDPETKPAGDKKVTKFTLATDQNWKDDKGEKQKETEWHNIELWGHDNLVPHIKKGGLVSIVGRNKTSSYEKEVGGQKVTMYRTVVVADEVGLL